MDVLMEEGYCDDQLQEQQQNHQQQHSGCSSTASTIEDDIGCCNLYWNDWSPVVDWGPICGDADDFHGLIESMMCENNNNSSSSDDDYDYCNGVVMSGSMVHEPSSTTTSEGSPPCNVQELGDHMGLRLVHLLMAAAEALTGAHKSLDLARVILVRLRELVSPAGGTNMERLAAHFTEALLGLLDPPSGSAVGSAGMRSVRSHGSHWGDDTQCHPGDALAAFQLLQDMSPYVKFGHFTANQAILEGVMGERRVHIIDYDVMEGVQWASLMQAMVSTKDGPPPPHLRITAITRAGTSGGRKSMYPVQETGRRLVAFAASIGLPFSFGQSRLDADDKFRPSAVKVVKGETIIANCVLHPPHLPHRSAASVASFLSGAATLGAKLVALVEEEGEIRSEDGFVGRFMDELHRYSAVWDSLEAGFPLQGRARGLVERALLGPKIATAVARAYRQQREEMEGGGGWGEWMSAIGFGKIGISFFNHCQARLLLGLFNDGYRVEEDSPNKLVLGWKSRRLISASIWSSPTLLVPPSTATSEFTC